MAQIVKTLLQFRIPGSGRSPGEGNGNPLQYSCLENSMDRGVWRATVHGGGKESGMTEQLLLTHSIEDYLNFTVLYNFQKFTYMISYNPIITPLFIASSPSLSPLISTSLFSLL